MSTYSGLLWIGSTLAAVLMLGMFRNHIEMIINFILRGILGLLLIYFGNCALAGWMPELHIGYNLISFGTAGFLGIPGVLMLFGINLYMIL